MKKFLKIVTMLMVLAICLIGFAGCQSTDNENQQIYEEENGNELNDEKEESEEMSDEKEESKEVSDEKEDETVINNQKPVAVLGEKYVDLNNRSFAVNGKVYTLGVNTLQDMINDNVPFDEDDIANANNNINKNYSSGRFEIVLGEYYSAYVQVTNDSDENKKIAECKLSEIYLPVHKDKEQNILSFAFPLTITEKELVAQAGEPTDTSEYKGDNNYISRKLEYTADSTKYLGDSGYSFEFINGDLRYVIIDYKE